MTAVYVCEVCGMFRTKAEHDATRLVHPAHRRMHSDGALGKVAGDE